MPREVLVPCLPSNADELVSWLSTLRGARVRLRVPRRGDKRTLAEILEAGSLDQLTDHLAAGSEIEGLATGDFVVSGGTSLVLLTPSG